MFESGGLERYSCWILVQLFVKSALENSNELKIDSRKRVPSWTRLFNWINKYVLPSLYMYRDVMGQEFLQDVIMIQEGRLSEAKAKMLEQFKKEHGLFEFKYDIEDDVA